jgi:hypothetical protein
MTSFLVTTQKLAFVWLSKTTGFWQAKLETKSGLLPTAI